jgi:tetratricopeptide (TPR) repeat protein
MAISKGTRWFAKGSFMAIAIYLGSTSLIHYAVSPPSPRSPAKESAAPKKIKEPPANEARFRASFEAGKQAMSDGRYATALDNFLEAERSADQLTDDQYNALKEARLQVAQAYKSVGNTEAANSVYRALADCANRDGHALLWAKSFKEAVARGRDAEQFSEDLSQDERDSLLFISTSLLTASLEGLQRYSEAAEAQQHYIDVLKASIDPDSFAFVQAYMSLEGIYQDAGDWHGVEEALTQEIEKCDSITSHGTTDANGALVNTVTPKNWAQYNLVVAYNTSGNPDKALSTAEDSFSEYSQKEPDRTHPISIVYHASDFAALALQIATQAKRQDDIDLWQKRASGGIKIIALHPPGTQ